MLEVAPEIKNLSPYVPGKPIEETKREFGIKKVIKLASNENALGPSPKVIAAIKKHLKEISLYPDGSCYELKNAYCDLTGFRHNEVVFANGSNELIDLLMQVFCHPGDSIVTFEKAFIAYQISAQAHRLNCVEIPLAADFQYDIEGLIKFIKTSWTKSHKIIFLANPNNPTGSYLSKAQLDRLISVVSTRDDLLLVMDEAYLEFARSEDFGRAEKYLRQCQNLLILRTLSKAYGLAGLRVGALVGSPYVIDLINRVRAPFNVSLLAQVAAIAALKDRSHLKKSQRLVWNGLDFFYEKLQNMGVRFWPSDGNFLLLDVEKDSQPIYQTLLQKGVILRPLKPYGLNTHLRMTVGTDSENKLAIKTIKEVLGRS